MKRKNKFGVAATILVILLVIRAAGQVFNAFSAPSDKILLGLSVVFAIVYGVSLLGLFKKAKWGAVLAMIMAVVDILSAATIGGANGFGAAVFDLPLLALGYFTYKRFS